MAIDPAFADANLHLAAVNWFLGYPALRREYLRRAAEHRERLSERQRLLLEVESAREAGHGAEAARTLDKLLAAFPDVEDAYRIAFHIYDPVFGSIYDPEKLLRIIGSGAAALPTSNATRNDYGYALLAAGQYPEALREFEAYAQLAPREPNPHDSLGEAFLTMGQPERAVESYSRALTVDPTFTASRNGRAWALAMLGRYDEAVVAEPPIPSVKALILSRVGRYREAAQAVEVGKREAEKREHVADHGSLFLLSSLLAIERGEFARAAQEISSARGIFERLPEERKRLYRVMSDLLSGIAEAREGRMGTARMHLESLTRGYRREVIMESWWNASLEGEVALAGGDYRKSRLP